MWQNVENFMTSIPTSSEKEPPTSSVLTREFMSEEPAGSKSRSEEPGRELVINTTATTQISMSSSFSFTVCLKNVIN